MSSLELRFGESTWRVDDHGPFGGGDRPGAGTYVAQFEGIDLCNRPPTDLLSRRDPSFVDEQSSIAG